MTTFRPLADPLALVVAGAGVATAAITGQGLIALLGAVGYGLIALPALLAANRPAPPVAPVRPVLAGAYAEAAARLDALAGRIASAVSGATPMVQSCVGDLPAQVRDLVRQCQGLLAKAAELDRFLTEAAADDPQGECARLRAAETAATDPAVRDRWTQARAAAEARLDELARIRTNRERLAADLAEVEAKLKQAHSRIVSLDSADESRLTGLGGELRSSLGDLADQVAVVGRVLEPEDEALRESRRQGQSVGSG